MSKKPINLVMLALVLSCAMTACGGSEDTSTTSSSSTITETNVIKSLTAKQDVVEIKQGDSILLTQYFILEGTSKLTAKQKECTYESSNSDVVEIDGKQAFAKSVGEATITVTSKEDSSKKCTFDIKVSGVFFDRDLSLMLEGDNFDNEWNDESNTGYIETDSMETNYYYIKDVNSKKWYVETDITVNQVNNDPFAKIGIFASSRNSTNAETMTIFFLNVDIGLNWEKDENGNYLYDENNNQIRGNGVDNNNWSTFGVAEMANGGQWAWNPGVSNSIARHNETAYTLPDAGSITFNTKFKLGVARDDMNFHVYVNDSYAFTYAISSDLSILYENNSSLNSNVGFFHFKSDVTFANYKKVVDETEVNKHIPKSFTLCEFYED